MYTKVFSNLARNSTISCKLFDGIEGRIACSFRQLSISNETLKGPRNPFIIFSGDKRIELLKTHPNAKIPEISKMIGAMWQELSNEEKDVFRARHEKEKMAYRENYARFVSAEKRDELLQAKREKRLKKSMRKLKLLQKEHGKPVPKGTNPYILFTQSKNIDRGDAPVQMYLQGLSDMWKKMPEDDKKPWVEQARKNSAKYRRELEQWQANMRSIGKENLLTRVMPSTVLRKKNSPVKKTTSPRKKAISPRKKTTVLKKKAVAKKAVTKKQAAKDPATPKTGGGKAEKTEKK